MGVGETKLDTALRTLRLNSLTDGNQVRIVDCMPLCATVQDLDTFPHLLR